MIKEWLLGKILKNKVIVFERDGEYYVINNIYFDKKVVVCSYYDEKELRK